MYNHVGESTTNNREGTATVREIAYRYYDGNNSDYIWHVRACCVCLNYLRALLAQHSRSVAMWRCTIARRGGTTRQVARYAEISPFD